MKTTLSGPNGQNTPVIGQTVFDSLIGLLKCDTEGDPDCVGMSATLACHSISFYGRREDGFSLVVEDFGHMKKSKWTQLEPTPGQIDTMRAKLTDKVREADDALMEIEAQEAFRAQDEADLMRYGTPGAIYSKHY